MLTHAIDLFVCQIDALQLTLEPTWIARRCAEYGSGLGAMDNEEQPYRFPPTEREQLREQHLNAGAAFMSIDPVMGFVLVTLGRRVESSSMSGTWEVIASDHSDFKNQSGSTRSRCQRIRV